jgi:hypothetical protein
MLKPAALAAALLCAPLTAHAAEQIPCWKVHAVLTWALGDEVKAERLAEKHGYTKPQIREAKKRCKP